MTNLPNGSSLSTDWTTAQEAPWWLRNLRMCFSAFRRFGQMSRKPTTAGWKANYLPIEAWFLSHLKAKRVAQNSRSSATVRGPCTVAPLSWNGNCGLAERTKSDGMPPQLGIP